MKNNLKISISEKTATHNSIDASIRDINAAIIKGFKDLAALIEVDYLDLLPHVFGDKNVERNEKILSIINEAIEIYDEGEKIFEQFQNVLREM